MIRIRGERRVRPGAMVPFKAAVGEALERHRTLDGPGTLGFDTYLDELEGVWIAIETYVDAAAMLEHLAVRDPAITERIAAVSDIGRVEFYGTPTPQLAELLDRMGEGLAVYPELGSMFEPDEHEAAVNRP